MFFSVFLWLFLSLFALGSNTYSATILPASAHPEEATKSLSRRAHDERTPAAIPEIQTLVTDMAYYKFLAPKDTGQAGDLLEHSLWVHYATLQLFAENSPFVQGFAWTPRQQKLLSLAGFLHDVGKAGRDDLFTSTDAGKAYQCSYAADGTLIDIHYHFDREEHAMIGFDYLLNPATRAYHLQTGGTYDFKQLFKALGITDDDIKIMGILTGIHYTFGKLRPKLITNEDFIAKLQQLATAAGYGEVAAYTCIRIH